MPNYCLSSFSLAVIVVGRRSRWASLSLAVTLVSVTFFGRHTRWPSHSLASLSVVSSSSTAKILTHIWSILVSLDSVETIKCFVAVELPSEVYVDN